MKKPAKVKPAPKTKPSATLKPAATPPNPAVHARVYGIHALPFINTQERICGYLLKEMPKFFDFTPEERTSLAWTYRALADAIEMTSHGVHSKLPRILCPRLN